MSAAATTMQVEKLVQYILHRPVENSKIYELYDAAISGNVQAGDKKLLTLAFNHPRLLPFLDAGLVFLRPYSELRRRIYIIFAILESTPEYSNEFMPTKTGFWGNIRIGLVGARAAWRAIVGIVIIKLGRL